MDRNPRRAISLWKNFMKGESMPCPAPCASTIAIFRSQDFGRIACHITLNFPEPTYFGNQSSGKYTNKSNGSAGIPGEVGPAESRGCGGIGDLSGRGTRILERRHCRSVLESRDA